MATKKTKEQVNKQSATDRLWDSLDYSYGKKAEQVGESYDQAISQQDNAMLKRGMQRSSYGAQTRANLLDKKAQALGDVESEKIADYQNRATALEQQELENERWERQFAEQQRQFNAGQELTKSENALNRAFQSSEREASQAYQSGENALNRAFTTSEREAQQQYQSGENALNRAFTTSEREAQQRYQSGENALNRAFTTSEREASQAYQSGENAKNRAYQTSERIAQQKYSTSEREAQQQYQSGENAKNRAYNTSERIAQQEYQSRENALNRAFTTSEREAQQQYQSTENALNRAQSQRQFDTQLAYQKERNTIEDAFKERQYADTREDAAWQKEFNERQFQQSQQQWEAQQEQWRQEFEYQKMSDSQKIAYNYVTAALEKGNDVSDDLLAQAGLSRSDYNAMKKQTSSGGTTSIPAWQRAGFSSKADYEAATAAGFNNPSDWSDELFRRKIYASDLDTRTREDSKKNKDSSARYV